MYVRFVILLFISDCSVLHSFTLSAYGYMDIFLLYSVGAYTLFGTVFVFRIRYFLCSI